MIATSYDHKLSLNKVHENIVQARLVDEPI